MDLLLQFDLRLAFGLAFALATVSSRQVTSGFFRNHAYVLLGLATLGAMVAWLDPRYSAWPAGAAAVASYVAAVCWLYESPRLGKIALVLVAAACLWGAAQIFAAASPAVGSPDWLRWLDFLSASLLLGLTIGAMFLGHWYLNSPTMELAPLRRLLIGMALALAFRVFVSGLAEGLWLMQQPAWSTQLALFLALRWLFGLAAVGAFLFMTWETLKIPNTQSATGILYVAVIGVFLGELVALLLSASAGRVL